MRYKMKIGQWLFCTVLIVLMTACGSSSEEVNEVPVLHIFVYAPENPMPTRAVTPASEAEKTLNNLQIWVFRHDKQDTDPDVLVGYVAPTAANLPTADAGKEYLIAVTDEFALTKPNVDVYVAANISASTYGAAFPMAISRPELEAAALQGNYFGVGDVKTQTVPEGGIPMTGVLHNCALAGESPVFSVGNVTLQRTVSKMRFVASSIIGTPLQITGIKLDAGMIPNKEYLFLGTDGKPYHIDNGEDDYNASAATLYTLPAASEEVVKQVSNPAEYLYAGQANYEVLVNGWIDANAEGGARLSNLGLYYLRETDKLITGTISYRVKDGEEWGEEKTTTFEMQTAGEFSRNHSWVVYAFYVGGENLRVQAVYVTDWVDKGSAGREIYNW